MPKLVVTYVLCVSLLFVVSSECFWPSHFRASLGRVFEISGATSETHAIITENAFYEALSIKFNISKTDVKYYPGITSAMKEIVSTNGKVDSNEKKSSSAHFDGENFSGGLSRIKAYRKFAVSGLSNNDGKIGRYCVGKILHAIQDFYSHSNWVELNIDQVEIPLNSELNGEPEAMMENPKMDKNTCPSNSDSDAPHCDNSCLREIPTADTDCWDDEGDYDDDNCFCLGTEPDLILTSGYWIEDLDPPGQLPSNSNKCWHGGMFHLNEDHFSGINKDSYICQFSPHFYYHNQAATISEKASLEFLLSLSKNVSLGQYALLFGLDLTLTIVIDTTSSMKEDIAGVKSAVAQIVSDNKSKVNRFILVPFNDPFDASVYSTTSAEEFLQKVNSLTAIGGGDCPEPSFNAIYSALEPWSSRGSTIYVFTDASASDSNLLNAVRDIASKNRQRVIFALTGTCSYYYGSYKRDFNDIESSLIEEQLGRLNTRSSVSKRSLENPKRGVELYWILAHSTGGQVFLLEKEEVENATLVMTTQLADDRIDLLAVISKSDINSKYGPITFDVDSSITELSIAVEADINDALPTLTLILPDSTTLTISNKSPDTITAGNVLMFVIAKPSFGRYLLSLNTADANSYFSIHIRGLSSLNFDYSFVEVSGREGHFGFLPIQGAHPLCSADDFTILIDLSGETLPSFNVSDPLDPNLPTITARSINGTILQSFTIDPLFQEYSNQIGITTSTIPNTEFYLFINGIDIHGYAYERYSPYSIFCSEISITIDLENDAIFLKPSEEVDIPYTLYNHGTEDVSIKLIATIGADYTVILDKTNVFVDANTSYNGSLLLIIPSYAMAGMASILTLGASSEIGGNIETLNIFIDTSNVEPPTCILTAPATCEFSPSSPKCVYTYSASDVLGIGSAVPLDRPFISKAEYANGTFSGDYTIQYLIEISSCPDSAPMSLLSVTNTAGLSSACPDVTCTVFAPSSSPSPSPSKIHDFSTDTSGRSDSSKHSSSSSSACTLFDFSFIVVFGMSVLITLFV